MHYEIFQDDIIVDVFISREGALTLRKGSNSGKLLIEASKDIQDKRAVRHRFTKVAESIYQTFYFATISCNGQMTSDKRPELSVEEESSSLFVANELPLKGEPHRM